MKDFKTDKGIRIDELKIDDKDIHIYLNAGNTLEIAGKVKELESEDEVIRAKAFIELAKLLFMGDYKLVSMLKLPDFQEVILVAVKYVKQYEKENSYDKKYEQKFRAE